MHGQFSMTNAGLFRRALLASLGAFAVCSASATVAVAQGDGKLAFKFEGASRCDRCHSEPRDRDKEKKKGDDGIERAITDVLFLNEWTTWKLQDRHSLAFLVLEGERSKRMGEILGKSVTDPATGCLNCHSTQVKEVREGEALTLDHFDKEGVTCETCHGPAEKWFSPHSADRPDEIKAWRTMPPAEKAKLGFADIHNPAVKTKMCMSCHLGSVAEGKVVTHEMYAAGHPPLPSVEPETLSQAMPAHWRTLDKKEKWVQDEFAAVQDFKPGQSESTRQIVLGSLASFTESLRLLESASADEQTWPDFAMFDCYACHHDLKRPSWRQERGYATKPGRPTFRAWPDALARASLTALGKDPSLVDGTLIEVNKNLSLRPFGDPASLKGIALKSRESFDAAVLPAIGDRAWDKDFARQFMLAIAVTARERNWDYDSARQLAWAFRAVYKDSTVAYPSTSEIDEALASLKGSLALDPYGDSRAMRKDEKDVTYLEDTYKEMLGKLIEYDPAVFKAEFAKISASLGQPAKTALRE
jgi:hypothetical protein